MRSRDIAVSVRGLSKSYTIAHEEKQSTLAEMLLQRVRHPFRRVGKEKFSALRDVSFDIKRGEIVGIIGRNGAGKSTLLKILSRITEPTSGKIDLYGRVGSLLEVGTGFHPELTGRENIFLNGTILGMARREIARRFDEIVEFAEVAKFLDTPVKHYSSGMYVRLAFAVAAHLESDILIIDEVLAVGDDQFQKRCLGKIQDVSSSGRTVLFVSHNMGSVARLCSHAIYLQKGQLKHFGDTSDTIDFYLNTNASTAGWVRADDRKTEPPIFLQSAQTYADGVITPEFRFDQDVVLICQVVARRLLGDAKISITVQDQFQHYISTAVESLEKFPKKGDVIECELVVPKCFLAPNSFSFRLGLFDGTQQVFDVVDAFCPIKIVDSGSSMAAYEGNGYGDVMLPFRWAHA